MMSAPVISQEEEINIPTVFQRVEYIKSDGTQSINLGFNFTNGTKVEVIAMQDEMQNVNVRHIII